MNIGHKGNGMKGLKTDKQAVQEMCDKYENPPCTIIISGRTYDVDIMGKVHER